MINASANIIGKKKSKGEYAFAFNGIDNAIVLDKKQQGKEPIHFKAFDIEDNVAVNSYGVFFDCGAKNKYTKGVGLYYHKSVGFRLFVSGNGRRDMFTFGGFLSGKVEVLTFDWSGVSGDIARLNIDGQVHERIITNDFEGTSSYYWRFCQLTYASSYSLRAKIKAFELDGVCKFDLNEGKGNFVKDSVSGQSFPVVGTVDNSQWIKL